MTILDSEIESVLVRVARDVASTSAKWTRVDAPETVAEVRAWYEWRMDDDIESLTQQLVDDVQQGLMDGFVDTSWPACPRHPNHPLWLRDGAWHCERDGVALAPLGELASILPPPPPEPPIAPGAFVRRPKTA